MISPLLASGVRRLIPFSARPVLLIWIMVGQGHTVLAVGAGGGCFGYFFLAPFLFSPPPILWEGWIDGVTVRLF